MDNKKLARLINKVVEYRLEKILTSKNFNEIIKERVNKEVIKLLIEVNRSPNPKRVKTKRKQRSLNSMTDLMNEETEHDEPRLPVKRGSRRLAKNEKINNILNTTANNKRGMQSFKSANKNQYQTEMDPMSEYMMGNDNSSMVQSELSKLGIDPNSVGGMEGMGEMNDGSNVSMNLSQEDMLSEGLESINVDQAVEVLREDEQYGHLVDAFTKDYTPYLTSLENQANAQRPGMIARLQPGKQIQL